MRKPGNHEDRPPRGGRALQRLREFARARGLPARPGEEPEDASRERDDAPAAEPDDANRADEEERQ